MNRHPCALRPARVWLPVLLLWLVATGTVQGQDSSRLRFIQETLPESVGGGVAIELTVPATETDRTDMLLLNGAEDMPGDIRVGGSSRIADVLSVRHGVAVPISVTDHRPLSVRWQFDSRQSGNLEAVLMPMSRFVQTQVLFNGIALALPMLGLLWGISALAGRILTAPANASRGSGITARRLVHSGLSWPAYLLSMSLFSAIHYTMPFITGGPPAAAVTGLVVTLAFALFGFTRAFPRLHNAWQISLIALPTAGLLAGNPIMVALLLALSIARVFWTGSAGSQPGNHPTVLVSALSLGLWAIIELVQFSPIGLRTHASDLLQMVLLICHVVSLGWLLRLNINDTREDGEPPVEVLSDTHAMSLLRKLNHDLRSPVHGVLGMTSLLQDTQLTGEQREFVTTAQSAGTQMQNQLDQLRLYTRLIGDSLTVQPRLTVIEDFVHETITPFARMASLRYVEVVAEILPNVPARLHIDAGLVQQVLRILLDNSVKFTESGVIQVTVRHENTRSIRIRVDDTGRGLPEGDVQQLFEWPGTARDSPPEEYHLGLPVARQLVDCMGGQIGASRSACPGSSFWFSLPYRAEPAVRNTAEKPSLQPLLRQKVLIVDDYPACRKVLENQTRRWGMLPEQAASGESALAMLQSHLYFHDAFDWVIIDYRMPEMNGLELLRKIRSITGLSHTRVIIVTGVEQQYVEQEAHQYGVENVLAKPVNPRELEQCLKNTD